MSTLQVKPLNHKLTGVAVKETHGFNSFKTSVGICYDMDFHCIIGQYWRGNLFYCSLCQRLLYLGIILRGDLNLNTRNNHKIGNQWSICHINNVDESHKKQNRRGAGSVEGNAFNKQHVEQTVDSSVIGGPTFACRIEILTPVDNFIS